MSLKLRHAAEMIAWGGACLAVLQPARWPDLFGEHSVCGPWGCGPPMSALVAVHGFWLVVFAAVVRGSTVGMARPHRRLRTLGRGLTAVGVLGAVGLVTRGA